MDLDLPGDPIPWLLEPTNPCVRWRTLRELLGRPADGPEVQDALAALYEWPPVQRILVMAADPPGYAWPAGIRATAPPGRDLAQLARLGVPPGRPQLAAAAAYLKTCLPNNRSSDCYLPQMVTALLRYGTPGDPDVAALVERVIANEVLADGNRPPTGAGGSCCGSHSCHNAVVRALDCVASVPQPERTPRMSDFLSRGAAYLASHHLYLRNHHRPTPIRGDYRRLHQPWALDWLTDLLDLLDVATRIGLAESPALVPALAQLLARQQPDGRWHLDTVYRTDRPLIANLLRDVEDAGTPGKWVTLSALLVLQRCAALVCRMQAGEAFPAPEPQPVPGYPAYPWGAEDDEARIREVWAGLDGMPPVLAGLVGFAREQCLETGWYREYVMGPAHCREWCCARARLVPARNIKAAFPVARTVFVAPKGMFTAAGLAARLGVRVLHEYGERVRAGSWVEKTLWRVRVDPWNARHDVVGIAMRDAGEMPKVARVLAEALDGVRTDWVE